MECCKCGEPDTRTQFYIQSNAGLASHSHYHRNGTIWDYHDIDGYRCPNAARDLDICGRTPSINDQAGTVEWSSVRSLIVG